MWRSCTHGHVHATMYSTICVEDTLRVQDDLNFHVELHMPDVIRGILASCIAPPTEFVRAAEWVAQLRKRSIAHAAAWGADLCTTELRPNVHRVPPRYEAGVDDDGILRIHHTHITPSLIACVDGPRLLADMESPEAARNDESMGAWIARLEEGASYETSSDSEASV